jgi:hypothetical protein
MSGVDRSRKSGGSSVQATWKLVEDISRNGRPSPETDAELLEHIKRLIAERDGLTTLAGHVRQNRPWRSGSQFLVILSNGLTTASESGVATKNREAFESLSITILKATHPDDLAHQTMLQVLYRMNNIAYLDAVRRDLSQLWEKDRQRGSLAVVQKVLGSSMPQREWYPTLRKLLGTTEAQTLKDRLRAAIEQLDADPSQGPAGARDAAKQLDTSIDKAAPEPALPVQSPDRSSAAESEKTSPKPPMQIDAVQSAHETLPSAVLIVTKTPECDPLYAAPRPALEKAPDDRKRPESFTDADSGATSESDAPPRARTEPAAADKSAAPADSVELPELLATNVTVTANVPKEEQADDGSAATELPLPQSLTRSIGVSVNTAVGSKGTTDPSETFRADADYQAANSHKSEVVPRPDPCAAQVTLGDHTTNSGSEPTTEQAAKKIKSPKAKPLTKVVAPPSSEGDVPFVAAATLADLEAYLAEMARKITGLFRDRDGDRQEFLARCARTERENDQLRAKLADTERNSEAAAVALEQARAASAEQLARISVLQSRLEAGEQATLKAEERANQLDKDLEEAIREMEETERRSADKVHRAEKDKELGVKTFRFELRRRIEPYLSEVLDDERDPSELSAEQTRFHQRLRKILSVLRETGVIGE